MDFEMIKQEIKEITEIASSVPDPFKERCFEILLQSLLTEQEGIQKSSSVSVGLSAPQTSPTSSVQGLPIPTPVRVFMARTGVTESELNSVLFYGDNEVHFIKEPEQSSKAQAQMEWALLLALKHAIEAGDFLTDPEDVRSICKAKDCYDQGNFARIFKYPAYEKWFSSPLESQGDPQPLADDGLDALAQLIKTLAGTSQ